MFHFYLKRYYSLEDVKNRLSNFNNYSGAFAMEVAQEKMSDFMTKVLSECGVSAPTITTSTYMDTCWQQYIYPNFFKNYICYTYTDDEAEKVFCDRIGVIVAWMRASDNKYSLLIKNQETNKEKLLNSIKTSNTVRFNDTPQNSGSYEDLAHNTNVTTTVNEADGATLLARLNEIEDNLSRLYEDWSDEFRRFILWNN